MHNRDIRAEIESFKIALLASSTSVWLYLIATFSRKLRAELPETEKTKIRKIIT